MIGQCQHGPRRRAQLRAMHRPVVRCAIRTMRWLSFWFAGMVAAALLVALILMLIAEAMRDPVTTMKPTAGAACYKSRSV